MLWTLIVGRTVIGFVFRLFVYLCLILYGIYSVAEDIKQSVEGAFSSAQVVEVTPVSISSDQPAPSRTPPQCTYFVTSKLSGYTTEGNLVELTPNKTYNLLGTDLSGEMVAFEGHVYGQESLTYIWVKVIFLVPRPPCTIRHVSR